MCICTEQESRYIHISTHIYGGCVGICILYMFASMHRYEFVGVCSECEETAEGMFFVCICAHMCVDI